jgi:hypothetical protein
MNANGYPFLTRRQILERIDAEPSFATECVAILQDRHERRSAGNSSMGWMASHAARATELATKIATGEATEKERAEAVQLVRRYSKQLARVFRERELAARPDLGTQAAVFGVAPVGAQPVTPAETAPPRTPTTREESPAPRKRGRPKGSKNKPKADHSGQRRRSRA